MFCNHGVLRLTWRSLQRVLRQHLAAFDGNESYQLETRQAISTFVCFGVRSIFASRHHVRPLTGFRLNMADCPGNRMHWDVTPDFIASESDKLINESKAAYDTVGALDSSAVTYENVIKVFLHAVVLRELYCGYFRTVMGDDWSFMGAIDLHAKLSANVISI